MPESTTDLNAAESQNFDAKQLVEEIATGEQKAPKVDVESDYEAAKELSVSPIDHEQTGAEMAEAATAPQFEVHAPETTRTVAQPTGNPDDYRDMAKDIGSPVAGVDHVTDSLLEKALEKGQPAQ